MELHSFILFTTIHYSSLQGLINAVNITLCICKIQFNIITVTYKSRTFPDVIWILGKQSVRFRRNVLYSASKSTWPRNVADCEDTVYLFSARGYYILSRECLRIFETSETLKQRHKGTSQKTLNCYPDKCLRFWFFSFSSDFQFFIFFTVFVYSPTTAHLVAVADCRAEFRTTFLWQYTDVFFFTK